MSVFSFLIPSINFSIYLRRNTERSATIKLIQLNLIYAFFKGWLPLSPPPDCDNNNTSFSTKLEFKDLSL
jgi:hypothetical protein